MRLLIALIFISLIAYTLTKHNHTNIAQRILHDVLVVDKGNAYNKLADITDKFGPRIVGSPNLENAIDDLVASLQKEGFENVRTEPVEAPHWVRGEESLEMLEPRYAKLHFLGLGGSIGTGKERITAEAVVVTSFDELHRLGEKVRGKIVVYAVPWQGYGQTVQYRLYGASHAARYGAVAALIRSMTHFSLYTPHTGMQSYLNESLKIPAASITVEDAEMIKRMTERSQKVVLKLFMGAQNKGMTTTRNVLAEIRGSEFPEQIVVFGGHIDSWDTGTGALDDGAGVIICYQALRAIKRLGLRPKRTLRFVAWTAEENGVHGGAAYAKAHEHELHNHVLAFESDGGAFKPRGFAFTGKPEAKAIIEKIAKLLQPLNATLVTTGGGGADIGPIMQKGVPGMSPLVDNQNYFFWHHTHADTITILNSKDLDECSAAIAVMMFTVADLDQRLPR